MNYKISEHAQNTPEWLEDRLGKITGSVADRIITATGRASSSVNDIVNRAVAEIIMQVPDETFQSDSMLRGKELEDQALEYFNFVYGYNFKKCGFMEALNDSGEPEGFGVSPDGIDLVQKVGLELKCPEAHTHLAYLAGKELPAKYKQQVQSAMMVSGFDEWVFGSYHPDFPCFRVVVKRDKEFIKKMRGYFLSARDQIQQQLAIVMAELEAS